MLIMIKQKIPGKMDAVDCWIYQWYQNLLLKKRMKNMHYWTHIHMKIIILKSICFHSVLHFYLRARTRQETLPTREKILYARTLSHFNIIFLAVSGLTKYEKYTTLLYTTTDTQPKKRIYHDDHHHRFVSSSFAHSRKD